MARSARCPGSGRRPAAVSETAPTSPGARGDSARQAGAGGTPARRRPHAHLAPAGERISIATWTIQRRIRDLGLHRLPGRRKRRPKQLRLFEKDRPGHSVQVDVKFVRVNRQRCFQYTALDDCTRFRVLRTLSLFESPHQSRLLPRAARGDAVFDPEAPVRRPHGVSARICVDGPSSWDPPSLHHAAAARAERQSGTEPSDRRRGILGPRVIRVVRRRPRRARGLGAFAPTYERFSMALRGHTPSEILAAKLTARATPQLASIGAGS